MIKVFISSTSVDLGSYRDEVRRTLLAMAGDIVPVEQNSFDLDYRRIRTILNTSIAECDAVICLVGFAYGQEPQRFEFGERRRSYSQLEYDIAKKRHKPTFLFVASPLCQMDGDPFEDKIKEELQHAFREEILRCEEIYYQFRSMADLTAQVSQIKFRAIEPLHEAKPSPYRHLPIGMSIAFLLACLYFIDGAVFSGRLWRGITGEPAGGEESGPDAPRAASSRPTPRDPVADGERAAPPPVMAAPGGSPRGGASKPVTATLEVRVQVDYTHSFGEVRLRGPEPRMSWTNSFGQAHAPRRIFFANLPPGDFEISITLNDAETWVTRNVTINAGGPVLEVFDIKPVAVALVPDLPDATVIPLDGQLPGASTLRRLSNRVEVLVRPGSRRFNVSHPEYVAYTTNVMVPSRVDGASMEIRFPIKKRMSPRPGQDWKVENPRLNLKWMGGFWMSETEVTVEQFERFIHAGHRWSPGSMECLTERGWAETVNTWNSPGFDQSPAHPVVGVSWDDANHFCQWLTEEERRLGRLADGQSYRLPLVVEYGKVAGGRPPEPGLGNVAGSEVAALPWAWPLRFSTVEGHRDGHARTAPVRASRGGPSINGLFDLVGNVSEWSADAYHPGLNTETTRQKDTAYFDEDGRGGSIKAVFGSSWQDHDLLDLDLRTWRKARASLRSDRIGFRLVLTGTTP